MDKVQALKDRQAGKVLEAGSYEVVVVANPANRWIGMKAGEDRVRESPHFVDILPFLRHDE
jgi:hypothetical protein